jgi:hypothetical protein
VQNHIKQLERKGFLAIGRLGRPQGRAGPSRGARVFKKDGGACGYRSIGGTPPRSFFSTNLFPTVSITDLMKAGLSKDQIMTVRREVTGKHCGLSCQLTRWLAAQIPPRSQRHGCEGKTTSIEYRYVEGGSAG